mmetsp:Transcript_47364/g.144075  ORF Transcript_47364/g.144075 Transcript_47364/m.144075 type:complete len:299 (+) Transcript_47364:914-1810(+)
MYTTGAGRSAAAAAFETPFPAAGSTTRGGGDQIGGRGGGRAKGAGRDPAPMEAGRAPAPDPTSAEPSASARDAPAPARAPTADAGMRGAAGPNADDELPEAPPAMASRARPVPGIGTSHSAKLTRLRMVGAALGKWVLWSARLKARIWRRSSPANIRKPAPSLSLSPLTDGEFCTAESNSHRSCESRPRTGRYPDLAFACAFAFALAAAARPSEAPRSASKKLWTTSSGITPACCRQGSLQFLQMSRRKALASNAAQSSGFGSSTAGSLICVNRNARRATHPARARKPDGGDEKGGWH